MIPSWRCPICAAGLAERPTELACPNGHRFDRAREGYVNLLPGGRLKGRSSGDDEAMVRARRRVFDAGLYDPVIDAVAGTVRDLVATSAATSATTSILDCGCGEGAYLARAAAWSGAQGWGIDISKAAVRSAARRHRDLRLAVASSYALPFDDATFDVAMSVFSPRPVAEMMRVLAPGGHAVVVRPGPGHLGELKALIYDAPRPHRDPTTDDGEDWPGPATSALTVGFDIDLQDSSLRLALLEMTPFWWSTDDARRTTIAERALSVTADMRITVFARANDRPAPDS